MNPPIQPIAKTAYHRSDSKSETFVRIFGSNLDSVGLQFSWCEVIKMLRQDSPDSGALNVGYRRFRGTGLNRDRCSDPC